MTKNEALFELIELGLSVVLRSQSYNESVPTLFQIGRGIQDEICPKVEGASSSDYVKAWQWLQENDKVLNKS